MDKQKQMENIQEGLKALSKNEVAFNKAKELAKELMGKFPETQKDNGLKLILIYACSKLPMDKLETVIANHYKSKISKYAKLAEGLTTSSSNPDVLFMILFSQIERSDLSHRVYVLSRTEIREHVKFPRDKDGDAEHNTMSLSLWDFDTKKIISLFVVDNFIENYSKLEQGKYYKLNIGTFNPEKNTWYLSSDPSIVEIDGTEYNGKQMEDEMASYILKNYRLIKPPVSEIVEDSKLHKGNKYAFYGRYVKMPEYVLLYLNDGNNLETIMMRNSKMTNDVAIEGNAVILTGSVQKTKPAENQPQIVDYILFPEIFLVEGNDEAQESDTADNDKDLEDLQKLVD